MKAKKATSLDAENALFEEKEYALVAIESEYGYWQRIR